MIRISSPGIDAELFAIPVVGVLFEYLALGYWMARNLVNQKNSDQLPDFLQEVAGFFPNKRKLVENSRDPIYLICRHLMTSKHSGVVNWLWLLALCYQNEGRQVHIIAQSNSFKNFDLEKYGVQIHLINPSLKYQKSKMPLIHSWTISAEKSLSALIDKFGRGPIIGTQSSLEADIHIPDGCTLNLLLVTNHILQRQSLKQKLNSRRLQAMRLAEVDLITRSDVNLIADSHEFVANYKESMGIQKHHLSISISPVLVMDGNNEHSVRRSEVVYLGRRDERKNLSCLLEAWETVSINHPDWKLLIYGDPGNDAEVEKKLRKSNSRSVFVEGRISESGKRKILSLASILVVPSTYESFGIVAVEGIKAGCLVLAANVGGLKEIIQIKSLLFDPQSPDELAGKLKYFIENAHQREKVAKDLLKEGDKYSLIKSFRIFNSLVIS
jgi:glycosyltransferase involved in cell wall biosynthesis